MLAYSISKIEKKCVFRTLDYTPIVTSADCEKEKKFIKAYRKVRKLANVKLAPSDPKREKAVENSTNGVVGISFNTKKYDLGHNKAESR